jgi:hypothetical protein
VRDLRSNQLQRSITSLVRENGALKERLARYEDALRYIKGDDVVGYEAHMRPEEVAKKVLG